MTLRASSSAASPKTPATDSSVAPWSAAIQPAGARAAPALLRLAPPIQRQRQRHVLLRRQVRHEMGAWNTTPTGLRRNRVSSASPAVVSSSPHTSTDPASARSTPEITLSSVDFPHPDGPTTATNSPRATESDTPMSASTLLAPRTKRRPTPSSSAIGARTRACWLPGAPHASPGSAAAPEDGNPVAQRVGREELEVAVAVEVRRRHPDRQVELFRRRVERERRLAEAAGGILEEDGHAVAVWIRREDLEVAVAVEVRGRDRDGGIEVRGRVERERRRAETAGGVLEEDGQAVAARVRREELEVAVAVEVRGRDRLRAVDAWGRVERERRLAEAAGGILEEDRHAVAVQVCGEDLEVAVAVEVCRRERPRPVVGRGRVEVQRQRELTGGELEEHRHAVAAEIRRDDLGVAVRGEVRGHGRLDPVEGRGRVERERRCPEAAGGVLEEDRRAVAIEVRREDLEVAVAVDVRGCDREDPVEVRGRVERERRRAEVAGGILEGDRHAVGSNARGEDLEVAVAVEVRGRDRDGLVEVRSRVERERRRAEVARGVLEENRHAIANLAGAEDLEVAVAVEVRGRDRSGNVGRRGRVEHERRLAEGARGILEEDGQTVAVGREDLEVAVSIEVCGGDRHRPVEARRVEHERRRAEVPGGVLEEDRQEVAQIARGEDFEVPVTVEIHGRHRDRLVEAQGRVERERRRAEPTGGVLEEDGHAVATGVRGEDLEVAVAVEVRGPDRDWLVDAGGRVERQRGRIEGAGGALEEDRHAVADLVGGEDLEVAVAVEVRGRDRDWLVEGGGRVERQRGRIEGAGGALEEDRHAVADRGRCEDLEVAVTVEVGGRDRAWVVDAGGRVERDCGRIEGALGALEEDRHPVADRVGCEDLEVAVAVEVGDRDRGWLVEGRGRVEHQRGDIQGLAQRLRDRSFCPETELAVAGSRAEEDASLHGNVGAAAPQEGGEQPLSARREPSHAGSHAPGLT